MTQSSPGLGGHPSQRALAAIVFTDAVSFSARMHSDEVSTLKLLQRDFAEMRRLCEAHEGSVLKTTGDGLMLTFTSAVQAVACALAMQRQFAQEARGREPGNALQHRIGIHLGDVLVQDQDVMGDGVNIAARLQSEAEPGGICISQTVYDVVKNKLQMQVVSLGARDLKNIAQAMPVYRLLLEAQGLDPAGAGRPKDGPPPSPKGRRTLIGLVAGCVLAAAVVAGALFGLRARKEAKAAAASAPSPGPAPAAAPAQAPAPSAAGGDLVADLAAEYSTRRDVMQELHRLYLDKYDFNGLVAALREKGESPAAPRALQQMLRSAEQLVRMKLWLLLSLGRYNPRHPLLAHDLSGDGAKDMRVYLADDQRVVFLENGAPTPRDVSEIKPAELGAIIVSALQDSKQPPRPVVMGARAFARFYALDSMTAAMNSAGTPPAKADTAK
jgi:class 3 adenylate cyclase/uncharacterized membrane protein